MTLKPIASNMTELRTAAGTILFSYETPVAIITDDNLIYRTDRKWSVTTSRHINKWLASYNVFASESRPQEYFDNLIAGVK
jgi:hypothetical protein